MSVRVLLLSGADVIELDNGHGVANSNLKEVFSGTVDTEGRVADPYLFHPDPDPAS